MNEEQADNKSNSDVPAPSTEPPQPQNLPSQTLPQPTPPTGPLPTNSPIPQGYSGVIVGSQLKNSYKSERNYKKIIIKILALLVVAAVIFVSLLLTNIIAFGKFKTVTYDNGKGASFKLKFYKKHEIKNVIDTLPSTYNNGVSSDLKELVSKTSINDKAPLTLWLESNTSKAASFSDNDCSRNNLPKAFNARVNYIDQDVVVCSLTTDVKQEQNSDFIYIATFHDSNNGYLAYFSQDFDFQKLLSSPENAREGIAKIGLEDYRDDVTTILASIKPVD